MTIRAIYEKGVFRPTDKVEFPDPCEVEIEVRQVKPEPPAPRKTRRLGTLKGTVTYMAPDFDAPLDEFKDYMP